MDQSYRAQQEQLNTAKRNAQQNASVSYELLKKYLPIQNQMNGLSGLGVSESAAIDASNRYVSQLGQIEQQHAANSAELLENYRTEQAAAQNEAYDEAYARIANGTYHTFDELDRYVKSVEDKVSPEQYAQLTSLQSFLENDLDEQARVAKYEEQKKYDEMEDRSIRTGAYYSTGKVAADKTISVQVLNGQGTSDYRIRIQNVVIDPDIIAKAQKYGKNTAFLYDGELYLNRQGNVYWLERGKKDYDALYTYLEKNQR